MYVSTSYTGFNQAEYVIHILVIAPQEYVNIYSIRRTVSSQKPCPWVSVRVRVSHYPNPNPKPNLTLTPTLTLTLTRRVAPVALQQS